jgi:hypothetical protein
MITLPRVGSDRRGLPLERTRASGHIPPGSQQGNSGMRRIGFLGIPLGTLALALGGCQFVDNPLDGFGGFIGDTHTLALHPTQPTGSEETMQRVVSNDTKVTPLLADSGNVWPGPIKPLPTLQELQQPSTMEQMPPPEVPATAPPLVFPESPAQ